MAAPREVWALTADEPDGRLRFVSATPAQHARGHPLHTTDPLAALLFPSLGDLTSWLGARPEEVRLDLHDRGFRARRGTLAFEAGLPASSGGQAPPDFTETGPEPPEGKES